MVIHNFHLMRVFTLPLETNAPLLIDANAMLAGAIAFERLQAVARGQRQIPQRPRAMNLRQLAERHALNLRRQAVVCFSAAKGVRSPGTQNLRSQRDHIGSRYYVNCPAEFQCFRFGI